ncbi:MAG: M48 family peptidase [Alphaproteobacteria bacterium]|nr:M48 family peptidase [Alphaproteobacteria bacterium]
MRGREAAKYAGVQTILGTLAAVAAGVAAGSPEAGLFVLGGTQDTARRTFFTHSRAQEGSADAAALEYLNRASINPSGLGEFLQKLASQELLPYDRQSEWVRTHPITLDRVDTVQTHVMDSPLRNQPLPHEWKTLLARIQAKLVGFLQPEQALLRYTDHDSRWAARYARAIALYRTNNMPRALAILDELEKTETTNPYLYELRGQILLENSKPRDAAAAYAKAIKLLPQAPLINIAYARALLESRDDNQIPLALTQIQTALQKEPREPESWRLLATGWGRLGELGKEKNSAGLVAYALAEEAMSKGDAKVALPLVKRALEQLPKDHPLWLKASDLRLAVEKVIEKN